MATKKPDPKKRRVTPKPDPRKTPGKPTNNPNAPTRTPPGKPRANPNGPRPRPNIDPRVNQPSGVSPFGVPGQVQSGAIPRPNGQQPIQGRPINNPNGPRQQVRNPGRPINNPNGPQQDAPIDNSGNYVSPYGIPGQFDPRVNQQPRRRKSLWHSRSATIRWSYSYAKWWYSG